MTTQFATLLFPDYETAVAAAKQLGFWEDPEPIYEDVQEVTGHHYVYQDIETGAIKKVPFEYDATTAESLDLELLEVQEIVSVTSQVQVGMTEGRLRTGGQTIREDGTAFSWCIDEIGLDPVVVPGIYDEGGNELTPPTRLAGYAVNCAGELPESAMAYAIPYGSAGRVFAGGSPEPHHHEQITGRAGYVQAVADPVEEPE